jgi:hypothetical protein
VSLRGVAFFAGGMGRKGESAVIDVYDSKTGRWSATKLSMPRKFVAAFSADTGAKPATESLPHKARLKGEEDR